MPRNTGIGRFQSRVVPELLEHTRVDPFFFQPREWYPFSMTLETMIHNLRVKDRLSGYDKVFIPAQDRLTFDPSKIEADIIPYIHDIIHGTSVFKKNGYSGWKGALGFYVSTLQAVRYTRYNAECDTVLVGSYAVKRDLEERTQFDGTAHVVYQGVDLPDAEPSGEYRYDLLYVGSTIERKDPAFLQAALQKAVDAGYSVATVNGNPLDLPGDTYTGITEDELASLYADSRYYLHPSRIEGFGRGPVEAQQFGCIPLARNTQINREILGTPGQSWIQIDRPDDVLLYIDEDPPAVMVDAAQKNAVRYSWEDTVQQVKEVLFDG